MADQLNMGGLNLGTDSPRSYIPPHMRGKAGGGGGPGPQGPPGPPMNGGPQQIPPQAAMNGLNSSAWAG